MPAQAAAQTNQVSAQHIAAEVLRLTGIRLDLEAMDYLRPSRFQLLNAIGSDDAEGALSIITRNVERPLRDAGFEGVMTPYALKEILGKYGWDPVHGAIRQDDEAMAKIKSWSRQLAGQGGAAAAQQPAATTTQRSGPRHPLEGLEDPPAGATQGVVRRGESQPRHAPAREPATPGVQRHRQDNVRPIAPAMADRNARQQPDAAAPHRGGQAARPEQPRADARADASRDRQFDQVKVHGGKAALTIEADTTRGGAPTVRIEAAKMLNPAERTYDWRNKIVIQLTTHELQLAAALFLRFLDKIEFGNHGPQQDKFFAIERQTGNYAGTTKVLVCQGQGDSKQMCLVQITPADIADVTALFVRQATAQLRMDQPAMASMAPLVLRNLAQDYQAKTGGRRDS